MINRSYTSLFIEEGGWTLYKLISRANSANLANNRSTKLGTLICSAHARTVRPQSRAVRRSFWSSTHIKNFNLFLGYPKSKWNVYICFYKWTCKNGVSISWKKNRCALRWTKQFLKGLGEITLAHKKWSNFFLQIKEVYICSTNQRRHSDRHSAFAPENSKIFLLLIEKSSIFISKFRSFMFCLKNRININTFRNDLFSLQTGENENRSLKSN
jgi:hypothetical protein